MRHVAIVPTFLVLLAGPAGAVTLQLGSASVAQPGDSAEICVSLATGGAAVAGTQNDLAWDGACATLPDAAHCYAAGTHGKSLQGKLLDQRDFTYRALVLSLSDVDPIADGVLYCCVFTVEAAAGTCCDVQVSGAGAADPRGEALAARGVGGTLCVAAGGAPSTPTPTPTPTFMQTFSCLTCVAPQDGDGCQVGTAQASAAWPLAIAAALVVLRRRAR